ncbi:MarR family winged helix-turn-helix transcriptional regulator [Nocardia pseudobrasiliensis]|uniref:DNA-binding MarR family transcriptional regulator n=1 Tax=Nocardia pseudobrasiliensis TaxID=45979 RepID=A0A370I8N2_9NOCA|nr:MarR family winged helix-turn-helix transcriptional regulator [Nocardia pseudobrasiliensis]RDI67086.1 DNA-binding MarR family transcriptional regulator [Nocardia pseudobrasiliensis]
MSGTAPGEDLGEVAAALVEVAATLVRHLPQRQGVSLTTLTTLGRLEREGPARLTALAAAEGVAQPSMTQLIQRLQQRGLVERVRDPEDGRACLIAVTDTGQRLLAEHRRSRDIWLTGLVANLPAAEREALGSALRVATPIVRKMIPHFEEVPDGYRGSDTAGR